MKKYNAMFSLEDKMRESKASKVVAVCLLNALLNFVVIHDFVLWPFAMCTSVNCLTYILGMMLNCVRTE